MTLYEILKEKQRNKEQLSLSDHHYLKRVEAIVGYEIDLLLPQGSKIIIGWDDAERIIARTDAAMPDLTERLQEIHSALDRALGDTDISHVEDDDELRQDHPVQWAAEKLALLIQELRPALAAGKCGGARR